jgi:hypothetical protein
MMLDAAVGSRAAAMLVVAATLAACGSSDAPRSGGESTARIDATVQRPPIQVQTLSSPCEWLPVADVEQILGKLAAPPSTGRNAENNAEDAAGGACIYSIPGKNGAVLDVALQIDPTGSAAAEQASSMLDGMFARELSDGASHPSAPAPRSDGWDFVGGVPDILIWRVGHVAIQIGGKANFLLSKQTLGQFASLVRDRLPDLPFVAPGADANKAGPTPDPCVLLTRAEAEAVLGPLLVEPFRANEGSPLADGEGPSCAYYTRGHRVLWLNPSRFAGKELFSMMGGASRLIRSTVGGADAGDALDGPWDQAAEASTGALIFLKGDQMLEVGYRTSSTDVAGAAQLARAAVARL